jgi:hypothetical protein
MVALKVLLRVDLSENMLVALKGQKGAVSLAALKD